MKRLATIVLAVLAFGCGDPWSPEDAVRFDPDALGLPYRTWWAEVEECSGLAGEFERVSWFTLGSDQLRDFVAASENALVTGAWQAPHDIYLWDALLTEARYRDGAGHKLAVQHESLHDLLNGDTEHRTPAWDSCAV